MNEFRESMPVLVNRFKAPEKAEVIARLRKRLASLEQARSELAGRQHQSQMVENYRRSECYWLASNRDLLHPLSERWLQNQASKFGRAFRDPSEEQDLAEHARQRLKGRQTLDVDELADWLCEVNCLTKIAGSGEIRKVNVFTSLDKRGVKTGFSPPEDLRCQIEMLSQALSDWDDHRGFRALLVLVGVLAIHPFVDGNGRTARACFNAVLSDGPSSAFVPLRMIFDCSCGGFEIRLRDAIFNGSWGPLISYFSVVFDLC